jgi:hypothetical protein
MSFSNVKGVQELTFGVSCLPSRMAVSTMIIICLFFSTCVSFDKALIRMQKASKKLGKIVNNRRVVDKKK